MASKKKPEPRFNIHVIELSVDVWDREERFREENRHFKGGKPCVYVGMTGKSPEERFAQHKKGYKASRYARKYGVRLRPRLYSQHNPMTYEAACDMEKEKAIGKLHDYLYSTVGNLGYVANMQKFGREIAAELQAAGVQGVILTGT